MTKKEIWTATASLYNLACRLDFLIVCINWCLHSELWTQVRLKDYSGYSSLNFKEGVDVLKTVK